MEEYGFFPADWGTKKRRIAIEICETPEGVHLEVTLLVDGQRISMNDASEEQLNEHFPLLMLAEKMNDDLTAQIEELSKKDEELAQ